MNAKAVQNSAKHSQIHVNQVHLDRPVDGYKLQMTSGQSALYYWLQSQAWISVCDVYMDCAGEANSSKSETDADMVQLYNKSGAYGSESR